MSGAVSSPSSAASSPLTLEVRNLRTQFVTRAGTLPAVDDVSFSLTPGHIMGLVGESGSGKSVTGFSIMGLVDAPGRIVGGEVLFQGRDLTKMAPAELRHLQGNRIAMIFQDPMMTLNPVLRVDAQMIEAVRAHQKVSKAQARELARAGFVTGASNRNWASYGERVEFTGPFDEVERALLCDPQTSGGLLVSCAAATVDEVLAVFRRHGFAAAGVIGEATEGDGGLLVR